MPTQCGLFEPALQRGLGFASGAGAAMTVEAKATAAAKRVKVCMLGDVDEMGCSEENMIVSSESNERDQRETVSWLEVKCYCCWMIDKTKEIQKQDVLFY